MRQSRPSFLFLQPTPWMQVVCVNLYLQSARTPFDASPRLFMFPSRDIFNLTTP